MPDNDDYISVAQNVPVRKSILAGGEGTVLMRFSICKACGSLVYDTKVHTTWHKGNDK